MAETPAAGEAPWPEKNKTADALLDALIEGDFETARTLLPELENTTDANWEKLNAIGEDIYGFVLQYEKRFAETEHQTLNDALRVILSLHVDQKDRVDGVPTVAHPLAVARGVLEHYPAATKEDVIAALLHDALEDRPTLLAKLGETGRTDFDTATESYLRGLGREFIKERFGERVALLVWHLSSSLPYPHLTTGVRSDETLDEKRARYRADIDALVRTNSPSLIAIKWEDAKQNLPLCRLRDLAQRLRAQGDVASARTVEDKVAGLRAKYLPVLTDVWLPFWRDTVDRTHPLFSEKHHALAFIHHLLETDYRITPA